jgi:signal transduction histidine kinase
MRSSNRRALAAAGLAGLSAAVGFGWGRRRTAGQRAVDAGRADQDLDHASLFDRMLAVMDEERAALAHHLHDGPQQTMTAVRLMTGVVRDAVRSNDRERAQEVLAKLDQVASQAADELRRATSRLHPVVMAQLGLVQALGGLAETVHEEYGVTATFHPPQELWEHDDDERDAAIYRIAREAAVNAARHGAPPVEIRLEREPTCVVMRVEDSGGRLNGDSSTDGIGMRMMRERAARIGGQLDVSSEPSVRTSVVLRVPVSE